MEINITVRNKIASGDGTWIVCGNSDYTVRFTLDSEWDQFITRTMIVVNVRARDNYADWCGVKGAGRYLV